MNRSMTQRMISIVSIVACSATAFAQAAKPAADTKETAPAAPVIKLLEAGKADGRKAIRFKPKEGASQTIVMVTKMEMAMEMNGQAMPKQTIPPMEMTMEVKFDKVLPDGDIHSSFELTKARALEVAGADASMATMINSALASTVGMKGKSIITDRGITKSADFSTDSTDPMVKQQIESLKDTFGQLSAPVPAEPVGVGARWDVTQTVSSNGLQIEVKTTYTLKEFSGSNIVLDTVTEQTAKEQEIKNPQLPPGMTVRLTSMTGTGTGGYTAALDNPLPSTGKGSSEVKMAMKMISGETSQEMKQEMKLDLTIKSEAKK